MASKNLSLPTTPPSHTGDKNSPTVVRYFPVARKHREMIRFKGRDRHFLRLLCHKKTKQIIRLVPDNWSKKQIEAFNYIYPNGFDSLSGKVKKNRIREVCGKTTKMLDREQTALIAKLVAESPGGESKNQSGEEVRSRMEEEPVETIDTLLDEQETANLNIKHLKQKLKEWEEKRKKVNDKLKKRKREIELINQLKKSKAKAAEEEAKQKEILSELNALGKNTIRIDYDSSSDEELEVIKEDGEPDFPGDEELEGWFEHPSLDQWQAAIDFYIDDNNNVWDEDRQFVGFFSRVKDSISFKKNYEPEDYSFSVE